MTERSDIGSTLRVALVNPPFASIRRPSLGLTQLKWAVQQTLPGVILDLHYLNLDTLQIVGRSLYNAIAYFEFAHAGLGEWLFRSQAFPASEDNADVYLGWLRKSQRMPADVEVDDILSVRERLEVAYPELLDARGLHQYDVVGSTSMFQQTLASLATFQHVKRANPAVVTVLGGANCQATMGEALAEIDVVDAVFDGEALQTFPRFLARLPMVGAEASLVIRQEAQSGTPVHLGRATSRSIDEAIAAREPKNLPHLDYDGYFSDREKSLPGDHDVSLSFETSTGCWWGERLHCTFCGLNGTHMAYRAATPGDAIAYVNDLIARYADVAHEFDAVDNIIDLRYFEDVLPHLDVPEHVSLFYELKANAGPKALDALRAARVTRIQPGIEALSTKALRLMRKGNNAFQNIALLRGCRVRDLVVVWNILVGIPGETQDIYDHYTTVIPNLTHLPPPSGAFPIQFHRFSPYHVEPASFGLALAPAAYYAHVFPVRDKDWLDRVAYHFTNTNMATPYLRVLGRNLATVVDLVEDWRLRWARSDRPRLEAWPDAEGLRIVDGRGEQVLEYRLDHVAERVLQLFDQPRRAHFVMTEMQREGVPETMTSAAMSELRSHGLLFEEGSLAIALPTQGGADQPDSEERHAKSARFDAYMERVAQSRQIGKRPSSAAQR